MEAEKNYPNDALFELARENTVKRNITTQSYQVLSLVRRDLSTSGSSPPLFLSDKIYLFVNTLSFLLVLNIIFSFVFSPLPCDEYPPRQFCFRRRSVFLGLIQVPHFAMRSELK